MINFDLKDRVAIVTGGAQGFGLAITERFIDSGAKVVIWDIDENESKKALESFELKTSRDKVNIQLEAFLQNLSSVEIKQFNETKDYSELIKSIKTLNINDSKLNNYEDIKQIDDHIIESMIKRFFSNA